MNNHYEEIIEKNREMLIAMINTCIDDLERELGFPVEEERFFYLRTNPYFFRGRSQKPCI